MTLAIARSSSDSHTNHQAKQSIKIPGPLTFIATPFVESKLQKALAGMEYGRARMDKGKVAAGWADLPQHR